MSEYREAIGVVLGLGMCGGFLLLIGRSLNPYVGADLTLLGIVMLGGAMLLGVLLIVGVLTTIFEEL